ncbi:MAG: lipoprotein-releasing ABC transporter permease subunit [Sinobacteraceae bacterium]|nr:lipoprotein-releasing ABC transporter permease subunit [Nevskiaceae bacterium]MCP5360701.1 lipoprotein-releasing ABC transporter permease subunit [Nevskiaceae bacterium]
MSMFTSSYEWLIGTRYLRSAHRRGFVSFVALISVAGLMLGVAVLIVVLSVMNGFERELRARILSVTSHATLMGLEGALPDWRAAREQALRTPGVRQAVPYVEAQAMLANGPRVVGTAVRGVDPAEERKAVGLAQHIRGGQLEDLQPGSWRIILGAALAEELGVEVGGSVVLIAPEGAATPDGIVPRMRRFTVAGTFESGMYEFDRGLALLNLADAARIYRLGDRVSGVRLALDDPFRAPETVRQLALDLGGGFYVSDWTRNHANFFRSIELTKSMMFVILLMIVGVAAFNIVATLVMIVKEKQSDIAILRTLGAGPRNVLATFALQGTLIGLAGTAAGAALGVLLSRNLQSLVHALERLLGVQFLDARVYFMSDLPALVEWRDVAQICGVAFLLCALATLYPAWRAARTQPADALRHD